MAQYLFPFDRVNKGTDIIIYGFGAVGQSFAQQIRTINYCNIVAIVDKNADRFGFYEYKVENVEVLSRYSFDSIIIALLDERLAESVSNELKEKYGILQEKFIYGQIGMLPDNASFTCGLEQLLSGFQNLSDRLEDFFYKGNGKISFFGNAVKELKNNGYLDSKLKEEQKRYFKNYLLQENSNRKKIVLLRMMYEADLFDDECTQMFMQCIETISDDYESRVWLLWDISTIEAETQQYLYQDFYNDKRRLIRENAEFFLDRSKCMVRERARETVEKRIAITGFYFDRENETHLSYIIPIVRGLLELGYQVGVFPIDFLRYSYGECFIEPMKPVVKKAYLINDYHRKVFGLEADIVYSEGTTIRERINRFADNIYQFAPDMVIDASGEYSFCSSIYYDVFPTVALPMRGNASSAWFDKYACRNLQLCEEVNRIFHSIRREQMVEVLPIPDKAYVSAAVPLSRSNCGFSESEFLILTSGTRLRTEVTKSFADIVCAFLQEHNDARWVLVGSDINENIKMFWQDLIAEGKIVIWGYENNLEGLCQICDVYWNPDRSGAAGCILAAMYSGLPIITTDYPSDILPTLGYDNAIHGDYKDCKRYADELYFNEKLYKEKSILMKKKSTPVENAKRDYAKKIIEIGKHIEKSCEV